MALLTSPALGDLILDSGEGDPFGGFPGWMDDSDQFALAALRRNDFTAALTLARNRVDLYPANPDAHLLLALAWTGEGDELALNQHLIDLRLDAPELFSHVSYGLGLYHARQHQFFHALRYLEAVPQTIASAELLQLIAEIRERQGDIPSTIAAYEALLRKAPEDSDGLLALARLYLLEGDHERSLAHSRRLLGLSPDQIAPLVLSGTAGMMKGDTASARRTFLEIARQEQDNQMPWTQIGMLDLLESTPDDALAAFAKANAIENCDEAHLGISYTALLRGDLEAAEAAIRQVVELKDLATMAQAAAALHRGDAASANAAYRRAAGIFPDFGFSDFDVRAHSRDATGDTDAAILLVIANDLYRQGYFELVRSFLDQHKPLVDSHAFLGLTYARAQWKSGEQQAAVASYQNLQAQYPTLVSPWVEAADIAFHRGDMNRALAGYRHAVALKDSDELRLRLATLYNHLQRPDEALGELELVLRHRPDSSYVLDQIASTYVELKDDAAAALPYAERGIRQDADSPDLRNTLAKIYSRLGRIDEAAALYEDLLRLDIASAAFYYEAGITLQQANRTALAAGAFERVLNGGPSSPEYGLAERAYRQLGKL